MLRSVKRAAVWGAVGVGAAVAAYHNGLCSGTVAAASGAVAAVAALLRIGFVKMMGGTYAPGSLRKLPAAAFAVKDIDENTWEMSDGTRIHHFTAGHGPEPVLVLHGGPGAGPRAPYPGCADDELLASRYTFHFFHQRGCGLSQRFFEAPGGVPGGNFMARMTALDKVLGVTRHLLDIESIRRHIAAKKGANGSTTTTKVHLLGHSFGGFLGTLLLAEIDRPADAVASFLCLCPADVVELPNGHDLLSAMRQRLAVVVPPLRVQEYDALIKKLFAVQLTETEAAMAAINGGITPFYLEALRATVPAERAAELGRVLESTSYGPCGYGVTGIYFSLGMYHDYGPAVKAALGPARGGPVPARVIHFADDIQGEDRTKLYTGLLSGSGADAGAAASVVDFRVVPGVVHFPQFEAPETFRRELRAWFVERA